MAAIATALRRRQTGRRITRMNDDHIQYKERRTEDLINQVCCGTRADLARRMAAAREVFKRSGSSAGFAGVRALAVST